METEGKNEFSDAWAEVVKAHLAETRVRTLYLLITEGGEYDEFRSSVLAVFSSKEAAEAAVPEFKAASQRSYEEYYAYEARKKEYLAAHFQAEKVYPPGNPFPHGHMSYKNEHYEEAIKACAPKPVIVPSHDVYKIEPVAFDCTEHQGGW